MKCAIPLHWILLGIGLCQAKDVSDHRVGKLFLQLQFQESPCIES